MNIFLNYEQISDLLRHLAYPVVELPHDGAEENVGAPGEVATPRLHVLPGLEPAPHLKIFLETWK